MKKHTTKGSIFDDLGFESSEAENLKMRAALMNAIEKYIQIHELTQKQAAIQFHVTQPRISDLIRGHIDKFTIDMLINMLSKAQIKVSLKIHNHHAA